MHTPQNRLGKIEFLIAALVVTAVAGCGTSQNHAPPTAATIAPAPEAAPPTAQEARSKSSAQKARSKSSAMRARMSPEVSTKLNTAMVLSQLHQTNLMEIELAKIAQEKGSIDGVRAYANQLVQDHTSLDQMVIAMAQKSGNRAAVGRSAHESAQEKTLAKKLKSANGAKFDKLFLQQANSDHESTDPQAPAGSRRRQRRRTRGFDRQDDPDPRTAQRTRANSYEQGAGLWLGQPDP